MGVGKLNKYFIYTVGNLMKKKPFNSTKMYDIRVYT